MTSANACERLSSEVCHFPCLTNLLRFVPGRLLFCHNGRIANFPLIRRALMLKLSDEIFTNVRGTTDSEAIFALILHFLSLDGLSKESPLKQTTPFGHGRLVVAIKKTLRCISTLVKEAGIKDTFNTLNFSLTDGKNIVVTRFCDKSPRIPPPSLYFAYGQASELYEELTARDPVGYVAQNSDTELESDADGENDDDDDEKEFDEKPVVLQMRDSLPGLHFADVDPKDSTLVVASNPLTKTHTWYPMPKNSIMWCTRGSMPELRLLLREKSKHHEVLESLPLEHKISNVSDVVTIRNVLL